MRRLGHLLVTPPIRKGRRSGMNLVGPRPCAPEGRRSCFLQPLRHCSWRSGWAPRWPVHPFTTRRAMSAQEMGGCLALPMEPPHGPMDFSPPHPVPREYGASAGVAQMVPSRPAAPWGDGEGLVGFTGTSAPMVRRGGRSHLGHSGLARHGFTGPHFRWISWRDVIDPHSRPVGRVGDIARAGDLRPGATFASGPPRRCCVPRPSDHLHLIPHARRRGLVP